MPHFNAQMSPDTQSLRFYLKCRDMTTREHVPAEMFANEHYADQLVERMGWALVDAEHQEQAIRA
jgi:hypothetical protein